MGRKRVLTDEERKERKKESNKKWREKQKAENAEEYKRKNRESQAKWKAKRKAENAEERRKVGRPRVSAERKREVNAAKMRRWRKKNPDKVKQYIMRYWVKKAIEQMQQADDTEESKKNER